MPLIYIKSLPFERAFDVSHVINDISNDFSKANDIALEHITVTWDFFTSEHYAVAGESIRYQPVDSHPILVELLVPDFNSAAAVRAMLEALASSISKHCGIAMSNVFVHCHYARPGMVFDGGEIVQW